MADQLNPGDTVLIIRCKHCGFVSEVSAIASETPRVVGVPVEEVRHKCWKCGEDQLIQGSDILRASVVDE